MYRPSCKVSSWNLMKARPISIGIKLECMVCSAKETNAFSEDVTVQESPVSTFKEEGRANGAGRVTEAKDRRLDNGLLLMI
ncbi:hypothetical protein V1477_014514 [Vespula maculifrons]|uniref:Uncharacterized protein n=1 Tax=Vespula maculifrons TaxID=7453 RepID=A0ABD2BIL3_VESMC